MQSGNCMNWIEMISTSPPEVHSITFPCLSYSSYTGLCWPTHDRWCQHSREPRQSGRTSTATVKMCQKSLPNQKAFINGRQGSIQHPKSKTGSWHQGGKQRLLQRLKRGQQHQRFTPYIQNIRGYKNRDAPHLYWGHITILLQSLLSPAEAAVQSTQPPVDRPLSVTTAGRETSYM